MPMVVELSVQLQLLQSTSLNWEACGICRQTVAFPAKKNMKKLSIFYKKEKKWTIHTGLTKQKFIVPGIRAQKCRIFAPV